MTTISTEEFQQCVEQSAHPIDSEMIRSSFAGNGLVGLRAACRILARSISGIFYADTHEYARFNPDDGVATIGISNYAQKQFGNITFADVVTEGNYVNAGDSIAVLESSKTSTEVRSPLSGTIVQSNRSKISENPKLLNLDPLHEGWLVKIAANDANQEVAKLKCESEYEKDLKPNLASNEPNF
ncbi:hypothetical protein ACOME3_008901 [Neoechinorhynchus agilis]